MRRVAGTALAWASAFLSFMAVLINAPSLFYMSFALIATIVACHIQSKLAGKALRIERVAPKSVHVGELVTVEIVLWSEHKIKRPLVTVQDSLPQRLTRNAVGTSLPVAPAFDLPVTTMYQFTAHKRGRFTWKNVKVTATDALGLTTKTVNYATEPTEIIVVPAPIPISIELPSSAGWGINEAVSGNAAGAGIEPRGIRQYHHGDSLRHVHWRSSARSQSLQVKEFLAGSQGEAAFMLQRSSGSDVGKGTVTSLDAAAGHTLFLTELLIRQGVLVSFPQFESSKQVKQEADRRDEVAMMLGTLMADSDKRIGAELIEAAATAPTGTLFYVLVSVDDGSLLTALNKLKGRNPVVVMTYDAGAYDEKRLADSAALMSEGYRQAGAMVVAMPEVTE